VVEVEAQAAVHPASKRQVEYIKRLSNELGIAAPVDTEDMSSFEASQKIGVLVARLREGQGRESAPVSAPSTRQNRINDARLGMAMKICFMRWTALGRDVWAEKRQAFIKETLDAYDLFSEIAMALETRPGVLDREAE
jgi:hypothetical protein